VLLLSYLVPRLYELKFKPRIEKKGNKVTAIAASGTGIAFRDMTKLLAPSTSLDKFGKLFGLEQKKAHFPFSLLRSVDDLKIARLPDRIEDWKSDLTGAKPMTEADLADAQALFEEASCKNLGDYLKAYLILDVEILYQAAQCWRRQLLAVVGVDFVEAEKFTISSLSYYAGLKVREQCGRLGSFFPNNSQHYRLLRRGMRG
jgi:hypothetical protein